MKLKKTDITTNVHKIPSLKFEKQNLTSYSGIVIFQPILKTLQLKALLQDCFSHIKTKSSYSCHQILFLMILHVVLGFKRLRGRDNYYHDPLIKRVLGLRSIPEVSTMTRVLGNADEESVENVKSVSTKIVLNRIISEKLVRITLDFDGSVFSTSAYAEGTAVGYNKKKKGARSYYPLFATVAQTSQIFDFHHRSGNVHDSNGALGFITKCFESLRKSNPMATLESRTDSAFFNETIIDYYLENNILFTQSVPFARFTELKEKIELRKRWKTIDATWSYFEEFWQPSSWSGSMRFVFLRQKVKIKQKGALQLDLFEPISEEYEYKVILTNKTSKAKNILNFHNGRGSQEGIFAEAKTHANLDYIPTRKLIFNKLFTAASVIAHNITKELQMATFERDRNISEKRAALWRFSSLGTLRQNIINTAGRLVNVSGELTLSMNFNRKVKKQILTYINLA